MSEIEVAGQINQIKVAAEIGYKYIGKGKEKLNKLIDDYSKDNSIDLTKVVTRSTATDAQYQKQGQKLRNDYINENVTDKKD